MEKKKRKNKSYKYNNNSNKSSTYNIENLSEDDLESLFLLDIQLKGTFTVIYGQLLLVQANFQGREVIYSKYNTNNNGNNSNNNLENNDIVSPIVPDKTVLQATYIFFLNEAFIYTNSIY